MILAALFLAAQISKVNFLTPDCRANIHGEVKLHAGRTTSLVFVARDTPIDLQGFAVWTNLTPAVRRYVVFPWSSYRGIGNYYITHQDLDHPGPNNGAELTVYGAGGATLLNGRFQVGGVQYEVDQYNYRYYPPVTVNFP